MIRRALSAVVAGTVSALILATAATAHDYRAAQLGGGGPDGVPRVVEKVLGGDVKLLDNGLYRVRTTSGASITTHGPDFASDLDPIWQAVGDLGAGGPESAPVCVTNPSTDYYQEVLYGYPSWSTNDLATELAGIRAQIRRNNAQLNADSVASGGPEADYKVRCDAGAIQVTAVAVPRPAGVSTASFDDVMSAADTAGFNNPKVDYTIFYDGGAGGSSSGACGVGGLWFDDRPIADNFNNNPAAAGAGYGVTFGSCWVGRTSMHENGHNQGAVQQAAPNSSGDGGHCDELNDLMCYSDGGDDADYPIACAVVTSADQYDCGYDTYFDAATETGEWLASNWNIGHTRNRFIQFPDSTAPTTTITSGPTGPTADSTPTFGFISNELGTTFKCGIDDPTPDEACDSGSYTPATPLLDGAHTFYVAATDLSLNADTSPDSRAFSVDTQVPDTVIDAPPPATVTTSSVSIPFSSPETGATFQCKLDAALFATCSSPTQLTALSEGSHTFQVRARDAALNTDPTPASATFTVDLPDGGGGGGGGGVGGDQTPPDTINLAGPAKVKKGKSPTFTFASSEGNSSFQCQLDGNALTRARRAFGPCTSPLKINRPKKGSHTLEVRAVDATGNVDPSPAEIDFKVKKKKRKN